MMRGEPYLSPPAIRTLMRAYMDDPDRERANPHSPREQEVAKLGMRDRVELTRWTIRHGLVEP